MDEIEGLIYRMKKVKSRKDKRRLLAEFNSKQAEMFGVRTPEESTER